MRYLFPLSPWNQQRQYEKPVWVYPAHLAMYATYLRNEGNEVIWHNAGLKKGYSGFSYDEIIKDDFQIDVPFDKLPFPDRTFTDAKNPRWQSYGNYKFHPATHMMASNLCWYGKCTFCVDTLKLEQGEHRGVRSVDHVLEEIDDLIANGYKEVFDDSGTFPMAAWLEEFCTKMIKSRRNKKIVFGCNLKPIKADFKLMKEAGFRFVLVGVESANQETLDRIKKGQKADEAVKVLKSMSDAGLEPHITTMTSYPWETQQEEQRTIDLFHYLLRKGYAKTGQVSIYSQPRTAPDPHSVGHKRLPRYYDIYKSPEFLWRKITNIKRWEDFTYLLRGGRLVIEENLRKLFRVVTVLLLLSSSVYASPVELKGVKIPESEIASIEKEVKALMNIPTWLNVFYRLKGKPYYNSLHPKQLGVTITKPKQTRLVMFDGKSRDILAHEIAHVYGANEVKAREIQWKFST